MTSPLMFILGSMEKPNKIVQWELTPEFWAACEPILFTQKRLEETPDEVDKILALLGVAPGARILDLGCGIGRHALELARRGYQVTGVDITERYLERARQKAVEERLAAEFVLSDMRQFRRPEAFDAAINMFTTFGYFEDPADDRRVLENVCASLKPGGAFLMDVSSKEVLARIFRARDWRDEDGILILEERSIMGAWEGIENRWIVLKGDRREEFRFNLRLYSAVELADLLGAAGFDETTVYGSLAGDTYDQAAQRLIVVARRRSPK